MSVFFFIRGFDWIEEMIYKLILILENKKIYNLLERILVYMNYFRYGYIFMINVFNIF